MNNLYYCRECVSNSLRPNSKFINYLCIACHYSKNYNKQIYKQTDIELLKEWLKKNNLNKPLKNKKYDCIIGISGGKDSTRQALWVKNKLGMKPLLVSCSYPPKQMEKLGAKNIENLILKGFDIHIETPAPESSKILSLRSFKKFGNVCKSTEMALYSLVPRVAIEKNIKIIFWGENPSIQVGDSKTYGENDIDGRNLFKLNTLTDGDKEWIKDISSKKHHFYEYPSIKLLKEKKIYTVFLGPLINNWSNLNNAFFSSTHGLNMRPFDQNETGDISGASMLDEEFTNINMMIKYYKYGFGRASDICNEEIRLGRLSRKKAIKIIEKFDGICSDNIIEKYCRYVGISKKEFWDILNPFVNKKLFKIKKNSRPEKLFKVGFPCK